MAQLRRRGDWIDPEPPIAEAAMDQMVLFLLFGTAMLVAWWGWRSAALALFGLAFLLSVADYLHHATSNLPLSF